MTKIPLLNAFFDKVRSATPFSLSIRGKLVLVSTSLLVIPWVGYQYINEMEQYLRERQESQLLDRARIVASILSDQPELFVSSTSKTADSNSKHLYVRPLTTTIQIDGHTDDWNNYKERVFQFNDHVHPPQTPAADTSLSFQFRVGSFKPFLYVLFQVTDDHTVFRSASGTRIDNGDHLQIAMQNSAGQFVRYVLSARQEGKLTSYRLPGPDTESATVEEEARIIGFIRKTQQGYNIEIKLPLLMLGGKLAFAIADIDDTQHRKINTIVRTTGSPQIQDIGTIVVPSPKIDDLLNRLHRAGSRIWVTDKNNKVIALNGSLKDDHRDIYELDTEPNADGNLFGALIRALYRSVLKVPPKEFHDDLSTASELNTSEVHQALRGTPATRWRQTPDERVNILTAAYPVTDAKTVVGSVAIEETSNSILILQNRAVEILINLSMLAMLVAALTVFIFATRLSIRVRQLRDNADNSIGSDGRVIGHVTPSNAGDEIGDLSRSIAAMLNRLAEYNRYLETMASKLSHELRTPITVVRSSLENLESASLDAEHKAYSQRAKEGIERLSNILTRMSEATRLEQTIQTEDNVSFDLATVISSCTKGYQVGHQDHEFKLILHHSIQHGCLIYGVPDLIAQLLDKLVANAMDFATSQTPIVIQLAKTESGIQLHVTNDGPILPEKMKNNLFDSMVSLRDKRGKQPHLGLGLYIVRLIAEFHDAKVTASNKLDNSGVIFSIIFPAPN